MPSSITIAAVVREDGPVPSEQLFGIEIEAEQVRDRREPSVRWECKEDASLRNYGAEFVTPPINLATALQAIDEYYAVAPANGWEGNLRTGIHVHADMRMRTVAQTATVAALYAVLEPLFFELAGPEREECIYCIPWYRAPEQVDILARTLRETRSGAVRSRLRTSCKYSAVYLEPLTRFGTLEFRSAPTFDTADACKEWVTAISRLTEVADGYESADALLAHVLADGSSVETLARRVFSGRTFTATQLALPDAVDSIGTAARLVCTSSDDGWIMGSMGSGEVEPGSYWGAGTRHRTLGELTFDVETAADF